MRLESPGVSADNQSKSKRPRQPALGGRRDLVFGGAFFVNLNAFMLVPKLWHALNHSV